MELIHIRPAQLSELNTLVQFQVDMALETENLTLEPKVVQPGMSAVFEDGNRGQYLVAEIENQIAGSLMLTYEWSDWRNGTILWIQSVFVDKAFRGKGVYKALYAYVKNMVTTDSKYKGIRLYVDKTNTNAQKVYEKLGMNGEHYTMYEDMDS